MVERDAENPAACRESFVGVGGGEAAARSTARRCRAEPRPTTGPRFPPLRCRGRSRSGPTESPSRRLRIDRAGRRDRARGAGRRRHSASTGAPAGGAVGQQHPGGAGAKVTSPSCTDPRRARRRTDRGWPARRECPPEGQSAGPPRAGLGPAGAVAGNRSGNWLSSSFKRARISGSGRRSQGL